MRNEDEIIPNVKKNMASKLSLDGKPAALLFFALFLSISDDVDVYAVVSSSRRAARALDAAQVRRRSGDGVQGRRPIVLSEARVEWNEGFELRPSTRTQRKPDAAIDSYPRLPMFETSGITYSSRSE
ncbi:hypothetical protein EVAR_96732_1 [Eumeta japonica]|uniref:Uncharacterized protein n=1 Tax=Eumeta variegata TaxID=151549 RepID=A0A4C1Y023_EUMVA|nr:hypothetical protein EVAR_96732_1 [Eumeta japonica]